MFEQGTQLNFLSRVFVFREVQIGDQVLYEHFDCDEKLNLFPKQILSQFEHELLLNSD